MLEQVFSAGHQYHGRLFYDRMEGKYYDAHTDLYLEVEDLKRFGMPV